MKTQFIKIREFEENWFQARQDWLKENGAKESWIQEDSDGTEFIFIESESANDELGIQIDKVKIYLPKEITDFYKSCKIAEIKNNLI